MTTPLAHGSGDLHDVALAAVALVLPAVLLAIMVVVARLRRDDEPDD